jgi:chaperone modulatory protein CbpM
MTMRIDAIVELFPDLDRSELTLWVGQRWVEPTIDPAVGPGGELADEAAWRFDDIDVARVRMIYDLRRALGVPAEALPVVLSLLDQVYELRCAMRRVADVLEAQPREVRSAILGALRPR